MLFVAKIHHLTSIMKRNYLCSLTLSKSSLQIQKLNESVFFYEYHENM